jgi:hypothetical protein
VGKAHFGDFRFVERLQEITVLNNHPDAGAESGFSYKEFVCHEEIAAKEDIAYAPEYGWDQEQEKEPLS